MPHTALSLTQNQKNMAKKITTAKDILKQKGVVLSKFDTNGFLELVADFFLRNDPKKTLRVIAKDMYGRPDYPKDGYMDLTNTDFDTICDRMEDKKDPFSFADFQDATEYFGIFLKHEPTIFVDEPFEKNVIFALRALGGYVVKKKQGKYIVSLPI